uniref:Uncharacterized protein n=1 Tax=Sphaerodactylus townsendi TaxID=933632 RepID=A0ACB8FUL7_9SAUR
MFEAGLPDLNQVLFLTDLQHFPPRWVSEKFIVEGLRELELLGEQAPGDSRRKVSDFRRLWFLPSVLHTADHFQHRLFFLTQMKANKVRVQLAHYGLNNVLNVRDAPYLQKKRIGL